VRIASHYGSAAVRIHHAIRLRGFGRSLPNADTTPSPMSTAAPTTVIRRQYEAWPYPQIPLLAGLRSTHPWQLHADWLFDRCGSGVAPDRPRIWIAGCGTFEPYVFGLANPKADIVATDLSEPSLQIARRRCGLRRMRHVQFAACDLTDPSTWPPGEFDVIECYGVLMNLPDPAATLARLGQRLSPQGVLRLMVYPHFSRARVVQLQRLAKLCGLHAGDRSHPARLRALVRSLPRAHPLRFAFTTYADSRNDAGVVDAFLHAGDRGFTGFQLGELIAAAGLRPAYWFHRPWGQPALMQQRLRLGQRSQSFVLAYLDLWQELRSNFLVCLRRQGTAAVTREEAPHPLFAANAGGLRHKLALSRLCLLGGRLPSRTGDAIRLGPQDARALVRGLADCDSGTRASLRDKGLLLGNAAFAAEQPPHSPFPRHDEFVAAGFQVGRLAPNPLYAHLFAAFELAARHPELALPDLELQCARWAPWADPPEHRAIRFGLTPYATLQRYRQGVTEHLQRPRLPRATDWHAVQLRQDARAQARVRAFLAEHDLPARDAGDLRELWTLLFSFDQLFTTIS
jgi:hypothetical protein